MASLGKTFADIHFLIPRRVGKSSLFVAVALRMMKYDLRLEIFTIPVAFIQEHHLKKLSSK